MAALHTSFENLEKICAKNPTSILFARLAEGLFRKGDVARATEICRQGLRYRPSYVAGHVVMGKCHLASGRIEEARQEFQKVLQLDADHPAALWNLGKIDLLLGWEDLALGHFERALVQDALNADLKAQVDALRGRLGQSANAANACRSDPDVLEDDPEEVEEAAAEDVFEAPVRAAAPEIAGLPDVSAIDIEDASREPPVAAIRHSDGSRPDAEDIAALVDALDAEAQPGNGADDATDSADDDAEPFATLTLAELYVGQGLIAQALGILERVAARDPSNQKAKDRLAELRSGGASN